MQPPTQQNLGLAIWKGAKIKVGEAKIIILAYADDLVLLADSYVNMKKTLAIFHESCQKNILHVNMRKTELIIFQKGGHGHKKKLAPLFYGLHEVKCTKEYEYLGVTLT